MSTCPWVEYTRQDNRLKRSNDSIVRQARKHQVNLFSEDCNKHIIGGEYAKNIPSKHCNENHLCGDHAKNTLSKNHDEHSKYCDENHFREDSAKNTLSEVYDVHTFSGEDTRSIYSRDCAENLFIGHSYDIPSLKTCIMTDHRELDENVPSQESTLDTEDWMEEHLNECGAESVNREEWGAPGSPRK